jgi:GR25 family glycosyltransferase involved in LPS biosynthesis
MIKKYLQFINESIYNYELILESDVVFSDKFRSALHSIAKKNIQETEIAKKILELENKDLPVASNYFDILSDKDDKISFIPDRKAQEILKDIEDKVRFIGSSGGWLKHKETNSKIFEALGYTYEEGKIPYSPNSSDIGNVIKRTVSEISGKTYVWVKWINDQGEEIGQGVYNNEKLTPYDNKSMEVWSKYRQDVKIGKAIKALLKSGQIEVTDKQLEKFVNSFKAEIGIINNKFSLFEVVSGADIAYWYHYSKYEEISGTLGSSCMRAGDSSYFDIYTSNPNVCQLVILKSEQNKEKIVGRALLWKLNDGNQFMDRIYTINDSDVNLFREYAKSNGWFSKRHNDSDNEVYAIAPDGQNYDSLSNKITIKKGYYDGYPYMDTFKWFSTSGKLSTDSGDYELINTDGTLEGYCEYCGGEGSYDCGNCDSHGTVDCYHCDGNQTIECGDCDGTGKNGEEDCSNCDGSGKQDCDECGGSGEMDCGECNGYGTITCYEC